MCHEAELTFDCSPDSIRSARQFVAGALLDWGADNDDPAGARVDEILLVTSELMTNAVRASSSCARLRLETCRGHIVVAVRDDSDAPVAPRSAGAGETGGRGLAIVDALSEQWGTSPASDHGKVVWSKLAIPDESVLGQRCPR